jgi:hypothetical protein
VSRLKILYKDPEFLPVEIQIMKELIDKHEQYECQGRDLEARAMARAVTIMYRRLKGDFEDTDATGWGSL